MPKAATFSRTKVLEAAVALVESDGPGQLSARNVAARMGASTAPIYASFESIEALRAAVVVEAREALRAYTRRSWTDRPFLNEGTGLVMFAREKPRLFALLFLTPEIAAESVPKVYGDLLTDMKNDERFAKLSARERDAVLENLWFMALGMATLAYSGQLRNASTHGVVTALLDAGGVLIPQAMERLKSTKK